MVTLPTICLHVDAETTATFGFGRISQDSKADFLLSKHPRQVPHPAVPQQVAVMQQPQCMSMMWQYLLRQRLQGKARAQDAISASTLAGIELRQMVTRRPTSAQAVASPFTAYATSATLTSGTVRRARFSLPSADRLSLRWRHRVIVPTRWWTMCCSLLSFQTLTHYHLLFVP